MSAHNFLSDFAGRRASIAGRRLSGPWSLPTWLRTGFGIFVGLTACGVLSLGLLTWFHTEQQEAVLMRHSRSDAERGAKILDEQITVALGTVDRALRQLAWVADPRRPTGEGFSGFERQAEQQLALLPDVRAFWLLDARGAVIAGRDRDGHGAEGIGDFGVLGEVGQLKGATLLIAPPLESRLPRGGWILPLGRVVLDAGGGLRSIVLAEMDTAHLADAMGRVGLGLNGSHTLVHRGGVTVARAPLHDRVVGRKTPNAPILWGPEVPSVGVLEIDGPWDGVRRIYGYSKIAGTPLVAIAGLSVEDVTSQMERSVAYNVGAAMVASVLLIAVAVLSERARRRRRLVKALERDLAAKEAAMRTRSAFLAHMRHDLRTPLSGVIGFTDLVRYGGIGPLNDDQRDFLDESLTLSNTLLRIVDDMLDLTAIEHGDLRPRCDRVDVGALFGDVARDALALASEGGQSMHVEPAVPLGTTVMMDGILLHRALLRMVHAAQRLTADGGEIRLEAGIADGAVWFAVRDSGAPLSDLEAAEALAPWHSRNRLLARRHEGTGLALPLARAIAEAHGGTMVLRHEGGWNVATLTLPLGAGG